MQVEEKTNEMGRLLKHGVSKIASGKKIRSLLERSFGSILHRCGRDWGMLVGEVEEVGAKEAQLGNLPLALEPPPRKLCV